MPEINESERAALLAEIDLQLRELAELSDLAQTLEKLVLLEPAQLHPEATGVQ